jgi:hypothetical protein
VRSKTALPREELIRCRDQLKGSYLLGMESASFGNERAGKVLLTSRKREYDEAETIRRIECVTMEDN